MRKETRLQRYAAKSSVARTMPVSITTLNFRHDANLAFVIRAAACFGASHVNVIGSVPERKELKRLSGSMHDLVPIKQYSSIESYLEAVQDELIFCFELCEASKPLSKFQFNFSKPVNLVVGHEEIGTPNLLIIMANELIHIEMPGKGYCLNTAQTANIALYEASKQYFCR